MIGSSLSLCYPQIAVSDLLSPRALRSISPLTKHIRLGVRAAFFSLFRGFEFFRFGGESPLPPQAPNAHR
jgi:hypothetical protein